MNKKTNTKTKHTYRHTHTHEGNYMNQWGWHAMEWESNAFGVIEQNKTKPKLNLKNKCIS